MKLNLDQLKQNACRTLALIELIERSKSKARVIWGGHFYAVFGNPGVHKADLDKQNAVTARLVNYLEKTLKT